MKQSIILLLLMGMVLVSCSQSDKSSVKLNSNVPHRDDKKVGGSCEGCEAIYECPVPFAELNNTDTLADFNDKGPKLEISGTIYHHDGKTPAGGVVLYVYHTDQRGIYPKKGDELGWAKRHGYLRGWIKTDENGFYRFYTLRPASYPAGRNPAHIHPTIKEPGKTEYYIDEFLFSDDPFLKGVTPNKDPKGGNGVLTVALRDGMFRATRDIVLGQNIEDYID